MKKNYEHNIKTELSLNIAGKEKIIAKNIVCYPELSSLTETEVKSLLNSVSIKINKDMFKRLKPLGFKKGTTRLGKCYVKDEILSDGFPIQRYYSDKPFKDNTSVKKHLPEIINETRIEIKKRLEKWGCKIKDNEIKYPRKYKDHEEIYANDLSDLYFELNFFKANVPKNKDEFFEKAFNFGQKYMKCLLYKSAQRKYKGNEFDSKERADTLEKFYKEAEGKPDDYESDKMRKNYAYKKTNELLGKIDDDTSRKYWKEHYPERFKK